MDRSRPAVKSCCKASRREMVGTPPSGGGVGGLQIGSGGVLEEEVLKPVAGLAMGLGGFVT